MAQMFNGCTAITSLDLSSFNTSRVTTMYYMFSSMHRVTSIIFPSSFDTSRVTNMGGMFSICLDLPSVDVSKFVTSSVTTMDNMFSYCYKLTSLDLSNFNTANVTNMSAMFGLCSSLTSLNITSFTTTRVADMSGMFKGCSALPSVDVSSFSTTDVINMNEIFCNCSSMISLDISNFNTGRLTSYTDMFTGSDALRRISIGRYTSRLSEFPSAEIYGHTDWYSESAGQWYTSSQIRQSRLSRADTYTKGEPPTIDTPVIDITYSWEEGLEWVYLKKNQYGFWMKGKDGESAFENIKKISSLSIAEESLDDLSEASWESLSNMFASFEGAEGICNIFFFQNNSQDHKVYVSLQEQPIELSSTEAGSTTISGTTITSGTGSTDRYLQYRSMMPYSLMTSKTTVAAVNSSSSLISSLRIDTSTAPIPEMGNMQGNQAYIGVNPNPVFKPSDYRAWVAEDRADDKDAAVIKTQLKLIFTKVND